MNRQQAGEAQQSSPCLEIRNEGYEGQLNTEGVLDDGSEEDGIDFEGYEEYLEHLKSKVAVRPCSSMVNPVPTRPVRPVSARPRMRSTPRNPSSDRTMNGSQFRSSGGEGRKRQGEKVVHARIRAVYNNVGRSSLPLKQVAASYSAASLKNKSKVFQAAEMHDEYYRLLDSETELKAACLQEQQKRVKAIAHVRRLEEIIAMKDKKIESLLHAKAVGGDRALNTSRTVVQREMAERDRQFHALTQKMRQKISQQSQLLSSYEEAMQSLRSGMKNTNLMELEEERSQLYQELSHHQELLNRQRLEWESLQQKLLTFAEGEASNKFQISRLQQENKVISHENRKLEQEVGFLRSRIELLQNNLALEQRKRTYDRGFSDSVGKHISSSLTQKVMLAQALEEMKNLVRRESTSSVRRERLKSPKPAPRPDKSIYPAPLTALSTVLAASSAPKTPNRVSPSHPRPLSAAPTRLNGTTPRQASRKAQITDSSKIDATSGATTASAAAPTLQPSTYHDRGELNFSFKVTQQANPTEYNNAVLADKQSAGTIAISKASTGKQKQKSPTAAFQPCSPEANSDGDQQFGGLQVTQAVDESASDQITDEEMAEMQQQKLAAAKSALRLDVDDEIDSELSADLLDDAQHPILIWGDDVVLDKTSPAERKTGLMQAAPMPSISADDGALDDLYPSDFLDTDVQASAEDEDSNEDNEKAT